MSEVAEAFNGSKRLRTGSETSSLFLGSRRHLVFRMQRSKFDWYTLCDPPICSDEEGLQGLTTKGLHRIIQFMSNVS